MNTTEKRDAAMLADTIYFSIDGIDDDMMNKYQRGGAFSKAYGNMKKLVEHRRQKGTTTPIIEWKYVLFNWNDHEKTIHKAIELARAAGVDAISFCPTLSPFYGVSWRYHLKAFHRTLGEPSWKGKEIRFDQPSSSIDS